MCVLLLIHTPHLPRNVPSSLGGSQTSALNRVAEIENRIRSRKQGRQRSKPAEDLTLDLGLSPALQHSAESSNDQNMKGKLYLKNNTVVTLNNNSIAGAHAGVRSPSRAAATVVPLAGSETKSVRAVSAVNVESDEEDMSKLLGDSLDSVEKSCLIHKSLPTRAEKVLLHLTPWTVWFSKCFFSI